MYPVYRSGCWYILCILCGHIFSVTTSHMCKARNGTLHLAWVTARPHILFTELSTGTENSLLGSAEACSETESSYDFYNYNMSVHYTIYNPNARKPLLCPYETLIVAASYRQERQAAARGTCASVSTAARPLPRACLFTEIVILMYSICIDRWRGYLWTVWLVMGTVYFRSSAHLLRSIHSTYFYNWSSHNVHAKQCNVQ
jgi:hypothetical protein